MHFVLLLVIVILLPQPALAQFGEERFFFLDRHRQSQPQPAQGQPQQQQQRGTPPPPQTQRPLQRLQPLQPITTPPPQSQPAPPPQTYWWPFRRQDPLPPPQQIAPPPVLLPVPLEPRDRVRRSTQDTSQQDSDPAFAPPPRQREATATTRITVFGDSLADWLGYGLEEAFVETSEIGITRKNRSTLSLTRSDSSEFSSSLRDAIAARPDAYIILFGLNDHTAIKERETQIDPKEERWKELYAQRLDTVLEQLKATGRPVIWVGLPPMKGSRMNREAQALNEIFSERVSHAGLIYLNSWDGFTDDNGSYAQYGADVEGQRRRLRSGDGIHFTKSGARKLAHFVERDLRKLLAAHPAASSTAPIAVEPATRPEIINKSNTRTTAGPVIPLKSLMTNTDTLAGGKGEKTLLDSEASRILIKGEAPTPNSGRADDFRWPK